MLTKIDVGPALVIGQSLGGAIAALLAREYPSDVAGLVLLDPSPINDPRTARMLEPVVRVLAGLSKLPFMSLLMARHARTTATRMAAKHSLRPDVLPAFLVAAEASYPSMYAAVAGLSRLAEGFDETQLRKVPAAVVTADRPTGHRMRVAHQRFARALDAPLLAWPGANHAVHLTHPDEVLDTCRTVLRQVINVREAFRDLH